MKFRPRGLRTPAIRSLAVVLALAIVTILVANSTGDSGRPAANHSPAAPKLGSSNGNAAPLTHGTASQRRDSRALDNVLRYTPFVTAGTKRKREVALTFDDGPSPYTQSIMKTLLKTRTPATFFVVGQQLNSFSSVLRDQIRHGFELGDHTENHKWLPRINPRDQYGQVNDAAIRIRQLGAAFPRLFRPPYGALSGSTFRVLHGLRMLTVLWSVDPGDWRRPGTSTIVSRVLAQAAPGAIVILHDGGGYRDQTVAALPAIIDGLKRRHFKLVAVSQLLRDNPPPRHQALPRLTGQ